MQQKRELRPTFFHCAALATPTFFRACTILKHNVLRAIPVSNTRRKAGMQIQACSHCCCWRHLLQLLPFPGCHACFSRERGQSRSKRPAVFYFHQSPKFIIIPPIRMSLDYCSLNISHIRVNESIHYRHNTVMHMSSKLHVCL